MTLSKSVGEKSRSRLPPPCRLSIPLLIMPFRRFPQQTPIAGPGNSSGTNQLAQTEPIEEPGQGSDCCQQQNQIPNRGQIAEDSHGDSL